MPLPENIVARTKEPAWDLPLLLETEAKARDVLHDVVAELILGRVVESVQRCRRASEVEWKNTREGMARLISQCTFNYNLRGPKEYIAVRDMRYSALEVRIVDSRDGASDQPSKVIEYEVRLYVRSKPGWVRSGTFRFPLAGPLAGKMPRNQFPFIRAMVVELLKSIKGI